jgi:hypothetical protein
MAGKKAGRDVQQVGDRPKMDGEAASEFGV